MLAEGQSSKRVPNNCAAPPRALSKQGALYSVKPVNERKTPKASSPQRPWQALYEDRLPLYNRLEGEVRFALDHALTAEGIKTHSVTSRVKTLASLEDKAQRKEYADPLTEAPDIVGARVVALFLSDLPRISDLVKSMFDVRASEDKIDPATFGYMSLHYEALIRSEHSGPRYDAIRGIPFEIQVRTILMDAWANVSHYLAYKGEDTIPVSLRRDFFALSGLFYVADKHFEMFVGGARELQRETVQDLRAGRNTDLDLNVETLSAFLRTRFPARREAGREAVAELADDLRKFGILDVAALEEVVEANEAEVLRREDEAIKDSDTRNREARDANERPPYRFTGYNAVGTVRIALRAANPEYDAFVRDRGRRAAAKREVEG
jgi:putative GTP pyrophosphokinase